MTRERVRPDANPRAKRHEASSFKVVTLTITQELVSGLRNLNFLPLFNHVSDRDLTYWFDLMLKLDL